MPRIPLVLLLVGLTASGCKSACEAAADHLAECGVPPSQVEDRCGGRTVAACEATCTAEADCLVFDPSGVVSSDDIARVAQENAAYEDCLFTCNADEE